MTMTANERLVWAAVFAKEYDIHNPPPHVVRDPKAWESWECDQATTAAECATGAVEALRSAVPAAAAGFGTLSDVYRHAAQMTSGDF